ncbi:MAG: hypothetical protein HYU27_09190 [Acidobacteria bacterium]|nr:hypothetical protein [Acidobacteriota bacterium]
MKLRYVVVGDFGVVLVADEHETLIDANAANDRDVVVSAAFTNLHGPRRSPCLRDAASRSPKIPPSNPIEEGANATMPAW